MRSLGWVSVPTSHVVSVISSFDVGDPVRRDRIDLREKGTKCGSPVGLPTLCQHSAGAPPTRVGVTHCLTSGWPVHTSRRSAETAASSWTRPASTSRSRTPVVRWGLLR